MYVAVMIEKCEYDYPTKYTFNTMEEARNFIKSMQGVLICVDFHKEA